MSAKQKLLFILSIPIVFIIAWWYVIISLINWKNSKASILEHQYKTWNIAIKKTSSILTGSTTNNDTTKNKNNKKQTQKYTLLTVFIPKYFQNNWRKPIIKNLKKEKIIVRFVDYNSNKLLLKNLALWKTDIALIDLDNLSKYKPFIDKINFKNPDQISTIFNFLFNDYVTNDNFTIIPFAIDPLVTFVPKQINLEEIKFENIFKFFFLNPKYRNKLDVNIWLDPLVWKLFLAKRKQPFENFYDILYSILFQSAIIQNTKPIKTILQRSTNKNFLLFDSLKFIKYKITLGKRIKNCNKWTDICLTNLWKIKILFWPLSYLDISNTILAEKNKISNRKIYNFPYYWWNVYFIKWRGLIVNKKSHHKIQALKFINEYIKQGLNWNFKLWPNIFSAFNNIYEKQKLNLKYSKLINYEDYFELLTDTNKKMEYIIKNTKFLDVISWKYSLNGLFNNENFLQTILNN